MLKEAISDQKRLVRAEHWLRARYFLRARDQIHHGPWRILTVAGPAPREELACIRELMSRAVITVVDIDTDNLLAAIDAGANDAIECDLGEFEEVASGYYGQTKSLAPTPLRDQKFDAICLDLTGPANLWLRRVVMVYFHGHLITGGVMVVTFSYGREVTETIAEDWRRFTSGDRYGRDETLEHIKAIPLPLAARAYFLLRSGVRKIDSCLQYRGNRMPMVSLLLVKKNKIPPSRFISISDEDYQLAIASENIGNVYACPVDRIRQLRTNQTRKIAAKKAVATRQSRKLSAIDTPLLTFKSGDVQQ